MSEDTLEGGRGGTPAPTGGLRVDDLVASRRDTTTTWQGAGLLEDIESLNSSWRRVRGWVLGCRRLVLWLILRRG